MSERSQVEELLLKLMHAIADKFKDMAVLKGGMYLRLLNSPRTTQDLDYVFIKKPSRKEILKHLENIVLQMDDCAITHKDLNSRGLVIEITSGNSKALLEISVIEDTYLPPAQITTHVLANMYNQPSHIITAMNLSEAYSHKIAACLERTALRDYYDITIYQNLTTFDKKTLKGRLGQIAINRAKPRAIAFKEAAQILMSKVDQIDKKKLKNELNGVIPEDFFAGGDIIIKNSLIKLSQELQNLKE